MNPISQTDLTTTPAAAPGAPGADLTGRTLGDYHVLRRLGQGGMGQVYLAEQLSLKRNVALKILSPDLAANATALQRFRAEAEAVAKLTHANIVQVYAAGEVEGLPFIALEYVEGRDLREFVSKKGPPELLLALSILRQTAAALQRASEAGIVHRDIKPENILLTRKGEVKVADFGLSRCLGDPQPLHLTQSGVTMGTPLYMSPEQVEGKPLDCRTDIYSLGVTAYFMLAGRPPFDGATAFEVAMKHARDEPPPLAGVRADLPPALCAAVHKMMAKDPAQRHQTGKEVIRDLARVREGLGGQTMIVPLPGLSGERPSAAPTALAPAAPRRRARLYALVGASLLLALAVGAGLGWLRRAVADAPPSPAAPVADSGEADEDLLPVNDEEALRKVVEKYLRPAAGDRNVSAGLGLCLDLGMLYLEQHRLDDAGRFFERLEGMNGVRQYQLLGRLGQAMVLAFRDRPQESNRLFGETFQKNPLLREAKKNKDEGRPVDPDVRKMWTNAQFRFWMAQAVSFNTRNGLAEAEIPPALLKMREPKN